MLTAGSKALSSAKSFIKSLSPRALVWFRGFITRFLSNPFIIKVPFFLIFSFNKGTLNQKGPKGTTQEPRYRGLDNLNRVLGPSIL